VGIRGRMSDCTHWEGGRQVGVYNSCGAEKSTRVWMILVRMKTKREHTVVVDALTVLYGTLRALM
jgi:hypothetical protein